MLQITNNQTMSSREIAELTKKEHRNIVPVIEQLIDGGVLKNSRPNYYVHPQNKQQYLEYFADKRDSLVIVARLSPEFTAAVIDRWQELESKQPKLPSTYKAALLALVAAEEEKERLELENLNLTTVVDDLTDWSSIIRIAKHNGVSEKIFKWRLLKAKSLELGYAIKQVPSARYDYQNLYHLNTFRACYPQFDYDLNRQIIKSC